MKSLKSSLFSKFSKIMLVSLFALMPFLSMAQTQPADGFCSGEGSETIADVINVGTCIAAKSVVPLLFTIAIVIFIYGVIQYVINPEQTDKREQGRSFIIWSIIGLFVIVSVWGLVSILQNTVGVSGDIIVPTLPVE